MGQDEIIILRLSQRFLEIRDIKELHGNDKSSCSSNEGGTGFETGRPQFQYDKSSGMFSAFSKDSSFGKTVCYQCHTRVAAKDYMFTAYPLR